MVLLALIVGIPVLLVVGAALWFIVPTLKTFRGPDFEPTYTDDETVFQVQQKFTPGTGGAA
jgi:hypothetical protein